MDNCSFYSYLVILVLVLIILLTLVYAECGAINSENFHMGPPNQKSLYERLGGIYSIAAVVDHFSDQVIANPRVGVDSPNPHLREWSRNASRLPGLKFMRTLWVADITGGPYKFVPSGSTTSCPFKRMYRGFDKLNLQNAHCNLQISSNEFDAVVMILANSLDHFKVPAKEKSEVLAAFAAHNKEVV